MIGHSRRNSARAALLDDVMKYAMKSGLVGQVSRRLGERYGAAGRLLGAVLESITGGRRRVTQRDIQDAERALNEAGYTITPRGDVLHPPAPPPPAKTGRKTPPPLPGRRGPPPLPPQTKTQPSGTVPPKRPTVSTAGHDDDEWPEEHTISLVPRGFEEILDHEQAPERPGYPEIYTPHSSNVYSFRFVPESRTRGVLYVTFLAWTPGSRKRSGAGPRYAYYDVPEAKYNQFLRRSRESAGKAVWDFLRVRGTVYKHQHPYRLVRGTLTGGTWQGMQHQYVPRRATKKGFRVRTVPIVRQGTGRAAVGNRSQLPERLFRGQR